MKGETRENERECKDREREKSRDKDSERSRDRDGERGHHRSSRHRDRSDKRERGSRDDDDDHRRSRDRDYDRRRDDRRRCRSRSRSKDRSPSKRRVSGFDMAPPASAMLAVGAAVTQAPPVPPATGMFPNIMSLPTGQAFGGLPMMPIQAMTQQATRHARRVYVGGLSPQANEQHLILTLTYFSCVAVGGLEGPDRIFVGGLPYYCTELQARELLEIFGALKGFDLVKDRETGNSKGYAFCVYQDVAVTDIACAALNGIKMGDKTLTVRRANQGTTADCFSGSLTNVVIPRPSPSGEPVEGLGKVFLKYGDTDGSSRARSGMNGMKFGGNEVVAVFYPEEKFDQGEYGA
ncbi:hypothetical protein HID58_040142 [Brassica napus]|uniref:RRM domain-containing protein n=1 Tax=Brassica napus TaxID=3708 RepID=A0ABQ8B745_BRANA|nr:hypothetical protein HID58_040142 [Brassica napus]